MEDSTLLWNRTEAPWPYKIQALAAAVALGLALVWWWRRRRRVAASAPVFPSVTAVARALERLGELRGRMEGMGAKPFALEVSEIVRVFVEEQFEHRAAHQSTEEFLAEARELARLTAKQQEGLEDFLVCCDLAKFALKPLEETRKRDLLESAFGLVQESKELKPVPKEELK
jgi:MYXO-CTERM domain-containing protein